MQAVSPVRSPSSSPTIRPAATPATPVPPMALGAPRAQAHPEFAELGRAPARAASQEGARRRTVVSHQWGIGVADKTLTEMSLVAGAAGAVTLFAPKTTAAVISAVAALAALFALDNGGIPGTLRGPLVEHAAGAFGAISIASGLTCVFNTGIPTFAGAVLATAGAAGVLFNVKLEKKTTTSEESATST
jgi:hypothetical protein